MIGCTLRKEYESGRIRTENEFKEVLERVLSDRKKISDIGCLALQTAHGQHLVDFKRNLYCRIYIIALPDIQKPGQARYFSKFQLIFHIF